MARVLRNGGVARLPRGRPARLTSSVAASAGAQTAASDRRPNVLLLGAGKIGRTIAAFLSASGKYHLTLADSDPNALVRRADDPGTTNLTLDVSDANALSAAMADRDIVISALSFCHNPLIAEAALHQGCSYFDLTEDVATTATIKQLAERAGPAQIFMPQCGLAPGFIAILAYYLAEKLESADSVSMRVGALPQFPSNALKYNLTWSTDGLINEYCNPCEAIHEGRLVEVLPLEGLEHFSLDGMDYEAFNTSGGLGTLCDTLAGRVRELNYKTVRYRGHRDLMALLISDLQLGRRRQLLKEVLENAVPITFQDVVVIFCTVAGRRNGQFVQISDARKIYPAKVYGETWSAIQITTAAAVCAAVEMQRQGLLPKRGFVKQEQVKLELFLANEFGRHFDSPAATMFSINGGARAVS
jgi:saccharopine dehydrogenase-like NADP-dependent oxidoreductase